MRLEEFADQTLEGRMVWRKSGNKVKQKLSDVFLSPEGDVLLQQLAPCKTPLILKKINT